MKKETDICFWETARRKISWGDIPLVMGILNVTPDSFSDGGEYLDCNQALRQAERMIDEGASILDVGGESTRPGAKRISSDEEINRVVPIIEAISKRFDVPISIDTSKSEVSRAAIVAGAEIINDVSGLKWDGKIADVARETGAGLVLMHLRGDFETMHKPEPIEDIFQEISTSFHQSLEKAENTGIKKSSIALDIGIGFSKTFEQNLKLLAQLDRICTEFSDYPILVGGSRKSFIGKISGRTAPQERLHGSLAAAAIAVFNGAAILRVHDVKETVEALKVAKAIKNFR